MKDINIEKLELLKEYYQANPFDYSEQLCWHPVNERFQSPINIDTSYCIKMLDDGTLTFDYDDTAVGAIDNGQTIFVKINGSCILNGRQFTLRQFHFHFKSEHTINDSHSDMEIHFVHVSQSGRIAVIGILFELGKRNSTLDNILSSIDTIEPIAITLSDLFPNNKSYYHYNGSLTTPPLEENVEWYIFKEKMSLSLDQLNHFHTYYRNNHRSIQPLCDRPILEHIE